MNGNRIEIVRDIAAKINAEAEALVGHKTSEIELDIFRNQLANTYRLTSAQLNQERIDESFLTHYMENFTSGFAPRFQIATAINYDILLPFLQSHGLPKTMEASFLLYAIVHDERLMTFRAEGSLRLSSVPELETVEKNAYSTLTDELNKISAYRCQIESAIGNDSQVLN